MQLSAREFGAWPSFSTHEGELVRDVLLSNRVNYWTGTVGRDFESEFAHYVGSNHAIATSNGTTALDLALIAGRIKLGDEVVVTPRSFMASVSAVVLAGATPVFADVDRDSQNVTAETIAAVLTPRTKAVVCVHLAGWPCEMDAIMRLADEHGLFLIEDCAQAHGARLNGQPLGTFGHVGAWSFCQDKIMTTGGEGGIVVTNDDKLWRTMWSYKDHGKDWDAVYNREHPPGHRWVVESFGTNWRLTEMQSAIGRYQLTQLDDWVGTRRANAARLAEVVAASDVARQPVPPEEIYHAAYKHYFFIEPERLADGWTRDRIVQEIADAGVPCMHGACPEIYLEKAFDGTGFRPPERLPVAKELGETSVMMLVHPTLTEENMNKSVEVLADVLRRAGGH